MDPGTAARVRSVDHAPRAPGAEACSAVTLAPVAQAGVGFPAPRPGTAGDAGGTAERLTRLTWFITDKKEYLARQREVGEAYRRVLGRHFPAMSVVVVAGLIEDEALIEIEATAVL